MEQAIKLYVKSAKLDNPKAMMALGRIYEQGIGIKADIQIAHEYYDKASFHNIPYVWYWLGNMCETGQQNTKGDQQLQLALKFYKKAVESSEKPEEI